MASSRPLWAALHTPFKTLHAGTDPTPGVRLTRVTDEVIAQLRAHPEAAENQLKSGLRFWEHGLRRAYIWMDDHEPLCIQWLLTHTDHMALRSLPEWAGMYPPPPRRPGPGA